MSLFEELGISPFINAHDTYTIYGGSRVSEGVLEAMREGAKYFVDLEMLQRKLGQVIAQKTNNEGAYITNGAAGALLLSACVCMAEGKQYEYSRLPATDGIKNEIIIMRAQRNAYDTAIKASGAAIIEIGDADETLSYELEGSINDKTAAVFYFASSLYARGSLPLEETIRIAHERGVPVVVDAAAQLPPVSNLWNYTQKGADLVIFSGGKTLCGPQDSGLILGKRNLIEDCFCFGPPHHGLCRFLKTSRESMLGLYVALTRYLETDHEQNYKNMLKRNQMIKRHLKAFDKIKKMEIVHQGPVGQEYPRLFIYLNDDIKAEDMKKSMYQKNIYIGIEPGLNALYISPLNLTDKEAHVVAQALAESIK